MATTKTYLIEKWEQGNGLESEISFVKPSRYDHVQVWYREEVQLGTVKAAGVDCLVFEPRPSDFDEEIALTPNTGDDWPEMARAVATEVAMFGDLLDEEVEASIAERPGIEHLPVGAYLPGHICATCLGANPCECAGGFDTRNPDAYGSQVRGGPQCMLVKGNQRPRSHDLLSRMPGRGAADGVIPTRSRRHARLDTRPATPHAVSTWMECHDSESPSR